MWRRGAVGELLSLSGELLPLSRDVQAGQGVSFAGKRRAGRMAYEPVKNLNMNSTVDSEKDETDQNNSQKGIEDMQKK